MITADYYDMPPGFPEAHADCLWGEPDAERIGFVDPDDAIEDLLDASDQRDGTLTVCAYRRKTVTDEKRRRIAADTIEAMMDRLDIDEELSDPEGDHTEPTDAMRAAARVFVDAVLAQYEVWVCEPVAHVNVDVARWIHEERPWWLEKKEPGR